METKVIKIKLLFWRDEVKTSAKKKKKEIIEKQKEKITLKLGLSAKGKKDYEYFLDLGQRYLNLCDDTIEAKRLTLEKQRQVNSAKALGSGSVGTIEGERDTAFNTERQKEEELLELENEIRRNKEAEKFFKDCF